MLFIFSILLSSISDWAAYECDEYLPDPTIAGLLDPIATSTPRATKPHMVPIERNQFGSIRVYKETEDGLILVQPSITSVDGDFAEASLTTSKPKIQAEIRSPKNGGFVEVPLATPRPPIREWVNSEIYDLYTDPGVNQ